MRTHAFSPKIIEDLNSLIDNIVNSDPYAFSNVD